MFFNAIRRAFCFALDRIFANKVVIAEVFDQIDWILFNGAELVTRHILVGNRVFWKLLTLVLSRVNLHFSVLT